MNYFVLIGILIILIGFQLKLDSIAVVVVAAIVTALIGGLDFGTILETLGQQFVNQRSMSLFFLTLPIVGICERYGLREQAVNMIKKMKVVTTGRILTAYLGLRELAAAFSLRLGGHPQFIRPLIEPMAQGAAQTDSKPISPEIVEEIKGASAATENYGNFFAQNVFAGSSGVLLIVGVLKAQNIDVNMSDIALWSIPIAIIAFVLATLQFRILDKKIKEGSK